MPQANLKWGVVTGKPKAERLQLWMFGTQADYDMESMVKRMSLMRLVGCLLIVTASVGFGMQLKKELADHLE